jgi:Ser/Thr protein kinase RdoA (MazF antagonist)
VPITGGFRNQLWRSGDVVVRLELARPESVDWEHRLVRFFSSRVEEVIAPLETLGGSSFVEVEEQVLSVWPFVDASPARRRHEPHAVAAAELLARLHCASALWKGGQRPGARVIGSGTVEAPIHGDFYRLNLLMRRGRIVALVDWEDAHVDALEYELGSAVWEFCVSKRAHDFDRRLARTMLEAYGSDLRPADLVPLVITRLRYELEEWGLESDEPYRTHLRRSLEKLGG